MSFAHAPVSKGIMMTLGAASLLVSIFDVKAYFHLQLVPHISRHHQYWRLLTHHLACTNSSVLFLCELLLYNVGVGIERQFGSAKFASFLAMTTLVSSTMSFASLLAFYRFGLNYIPAGPTSIIFGILYQYYRLVPSAYTFQIFALRLTNKAFLYILAIQLASGQLPGSMAAALLGVLTGQIYRSDMLGLKTYRLPSSILRFSASYLLPLIGSTRPPHRSNSALPEESPRPADELEPITTTQPRPTEPTPSTGQETRSNGVRAAGSSMVSQWVNELTGRTTGVRVPSEDEINQVVNMFPDLPRDAVIGALQRSPNIEQAVETLLGSAR